MMKSACGRWAHVGLSRPSLRLGQSGPQALCLVRMKASLASEEVKSQATSVPFVHPIAPHVNLAKKAQHAMSLDTVHSSVDIPTSGDLNRGPGKLHAGKLRLLNDGQPRTAAQLEVLRGEILSDFHEVFSLFEKLHNGFVDATVFYRKHECLRHPPIFYMGHTASFYVNKLYLGKYISERIDPTLEMQTAVGVDEMTWDDINTDKYVWQSFDEAEADPLTAAQFLQRIMNYRKDARQLVDGLIRERPMEWPIKKDSFWWVIMMGIEHDRIHFETSSVILRQAPMKYMQQVNDLPRCSQGRFHPDANSPTAQDTPKNSLIPIDAGVTRLGRSWEDTRTWGWDNEFGKVQMNEVPAFAASEYLVSNKEFHDFVEAGGYKTQRFWSEEGWSWVTDMKPEKPRFWVSHGDKLFLRVLYEEVPMAWDWPAEVNHHEGAAFCKYLSEKTGQTIRLPYEDEYLRLRDAEPTDIQSSAHGPAWDVAPGNVNLEHFASPCPVNKFRSPSGVCDVLGNVWQHCASMIDVLDGFVTHPLYEDFTTPTVDNLHTRIMGGSYMSTGSNGASRDSRFGFRQHFYQHAGFRYVQTDRVKPVLVSKFEVNRELCNAYRFHFDQPAFGQNYPEKLAEVAVEAMKKLGRSPEATTAIELGCGPGRTVLELAKRGLFWCSGVESTANAFNATSNQLLSSGKMRWVNYLEGDFIENREYTVKELDLHDSGNVAWHQQPDFAALDNKKFHSYDLVLCAQPSAVPGSKTTGLLSTVHRLVRPGGLFIYGTQYDWAPNQKASDNSPPNQTGEQCVTALLNEWFDPVLEPQDLEFAKAQTARKFECGSQHLTFWCRREEARAGTASLCGQEGDVSRQSTSLTSHEGSGQGMYDDDAVLSQYLEFHYGPSAEYPAACARQCLELMKELGQPMGKALEVGGGPGRAAIELSKEFKHVQSGDYSQVFVDVAQKFVDGGELKWKVLQDRTSGMSVERSVTAKDLGVGSVAFSHIDAHKLPDEKFDLICGFNLIDRLQKPTAFLQSIKSRLNHGGVLVLSSPYTWLEEFTPKDNWLGGFKYGDNDGPSSYEGLKELLLAEGLKEVKAPQDVWFRIDSLANGRVAQQTQAQMTFWRLM